MPSKRFDAWLAGGLRTVMVPSGEIFAVKLPDVEDMLAKELIPADLRQVALKFGASSVQPETMDTEGLAKLLAFMRSLVAYELRYVWNGPVEPIDAWMKFDPDRVQPPGNENDDWHGWQSIAVTLADLAEGSIDGDDYAALQGIASRTFSCAEITSLSLKDRKLIDQATADRMKADAKGTESWKPFRGKRRGADAGDAGGQVEDDAGKPDRAQRRKAARSGSRVPAKRRASS